MNPFYPKVAERAGKICEYCRAPEIASNFSFEVEHIIPRSHGSETKLENLALACRSCNIFKSNCLNGIDDEGRETRTLFHPRQDIWQRHFRVNFETLEIESLTEIGRGTINRLRLNNPLQIRARQQWQRLGLFP
ncbi:MAG: HNH endonuclease [Pyrinomonadaceae bacterium]|nr:HNH endonuclease [Pyrinomonadaceae bacterium]